MRILIAMVVIVSVAGCGSDSSGDVNCGESFDHFYAAGCAMFDASGKAIAQQESIKTCIAVSVEAYEVGGNCPDRMVAWVDCIGGVTDNCEECNDELGTMKACRG